MKSKKRGPFGESYKPVSAPKKGVRVAESRRSRESVSSEDMRGMLLENRMREQVGVGFDDDVLYEQRLLESCAAVNPLASQSLRGTEAINAFAESLGRRIREGRKLQGKTELQGLPISIENRKDSIRIGERPDGTECKTEMKYPRLPSGSQPFADSLKKRKNLSPVAEERQNGCHSDQGCPKEHLPLQPICHVKVPAR